MGSQRTNVTGVVVSTSDFTGLLDFKDKKQFQGVKSYIIDKEMSGNEMLNLLEKFPKAFFALSFSAGDAQLKIKPKAPKSGKPGKGNEAPKSDFCKLITTDSNLGKGFVFEKDNFSKAFIVHDFLIEEIVVPSELKNEKDFAKVREMSRRKGKIIREISLDGNISKKESAFQA